MQIFLKLGNRILVGKETFSFTFFNNKNSPFDESLILILDSDVEKFVLIPWNEKDRVSIQSFHKVIGFLTRMPFNKILHWFYDFTT